MRFGHFDDAAREYVITTPLTPYPWINYLGSQEFFSLISHQAGGYSFYRDARMRRLTRYRYNNVPTDVGGRYLYVNDDGDVWTPSYLPVKAELDDFEARHGLGYTVITGERRGVRVESLFFVPTGENAEVQRVTVTNTSDAAKRLTLFSFVEFALWNALDDQTNYQRNLSIGEVEVEMDSPHGSAIYHKTEYRERRNHFSVHAVNVRAAGFDTDRESFTGPFNGLDEPVVPASGASTGSVASGWYPIGSLSVPLELAPGESRTLTFVLGYLENPEDEKWADDAHQVVNKRPAHELLARFATTEQVDAAFEALKTHWAELLSGYTVQSTDPRLDRMVNIWNQYQCMVTFNMSRSASYFETGIGRGMGFRDSNQDLLGFVHMIPERARERILDLAATQLKNGGAFHQYQPLTKRGNNDVGSGFNDDPAWLVLAVDSYLKETGDWSILDQPVQYENEPGTETPLYEHLQRSMQYTFDRLGPHNLPLIGRADWNDCLNLNCFSDTPGQSFQTTTNKDGKVAESVFIAGLFVLAAKEMVQIAGHRGDPAEAAKMQKAAADMEVTVWQAGWDGEWFRRAYDDFGHVVGSCENEEGQIFIEPQGMCIWAGLGVEDGRAQKALDSVEKHLATPHGIVLQQPAFSRYYLHLGEISSYPPGFKENAGVFCHTNPWIMIAETKIGRGGKAFDYYTRINPSWREDISDLHKCEPYVYAQMIAGKDAPTHGEAKNSWLSGTAAMNYVAITQAILGIQPEYDGLEIAPVIPEEWDGFTAVREFRGNRYEIEVKRAGPGNEVRLEVNGKSIAGKVVPIPAGDETTVHIKATIGLEK